MSEHNCVQSSNSGNTQFQFQSIYLVKVNYCHLLFSYILMAHEFHDNVLYSPKCSIHNKEMQQYSPEK